MRGVPSDRKHLYRPASQILIPWCAGTRRHERLVRKHVPDSDPGWIPAPPAERVERVPNCPGWGLSSNRVNAAGLYQLMRDRSYNGRMLKQLFALSCAHPDDRTNPVLLSTSGRLGSPSEYEKCKTNAPTNRH